MTLGIAAQPEALIVRIALLHTADVHVETFDGIFHDLCAGAELDHHVDADLLDRARRGGPDAVRLDVQAVLAELATADAVLCTCSTLGPLVDEVALSHENILRIDRPLMEQACRDGDNVLLALCLDSTRAATTALFQECAEQCDRRINMFVTECPGAWPLFEAGNLDAYAQSIVASVRSEMARLSEIDCIVLTQASMRVAEAALHGIGVPVRSAPVIAAKRCIALAREMQSARRQSG